MDTAITLLEDAAVVDAWRNSSAAKILWLDGSALPPSQVIVHVLAGTEEVLGSQDHLAVALMRNFSPIKRYIELILCRNGQLSEHSQSLYGRLGVPIILLPSCHQSAAQVDPYFIASAIAQQVILPMFPSLAIQLLVHWETACVRPWKQRVGPQPGNSQCLATLRGLLCRLDVSRSRHHFDSRLRWYFWTLTEYCIEIRTWNVNLSRSVSPI